MKTKYYKNDDLMPAIPPEDYKGSQADWMVALVERGLCDDSDGLWHGDVMIPCSIWWEILEQCEK
jgi:hypothetical protein